MLNCVSVSSAPPQTVSTVARRETRVSKFAFRNSQSKISFMPISESDIEKIAQLAHLEITDDERRMFAPQIAEIVTYVEQLNEIDTGSVEPALGGLTPAGERTESSVPTKCSRHLVRQSLSIRRQTRRPDTFA